MAFRIHIGMRKIKSILAVILSFFVWQGIRYFFPSLEIHPIFAYVYSIIEMRESLQKTKDAGKLRVLATGIGLVIGLLFVVCSEYLASLLQREMLHAFMELVFILLAALCALTVAELFGCKDFCGAAAIITVICMVSHSEESVYLYAALRAVQTLIGVFSAMLINWIVRTKPQKSFDA